MNSTDHDHVSELFLKALELEPEERAAFLDVQCGRDPELRTEVESLLAHHDRLPEMLKTGAATMQANSLPERIGPYRIIEKLGDGGMGVVYRALQTEPIRREVALKLIKVGIETEPVIARFESERQALALMNHPNIARVLDAGATEEGRPYFAMEYVPGEPITEYCDRYRLSIRDRLELFLQVCEGVQHAHQKAVIHRDIKASNVLVTTVGGRRVPKIIDFGVAKALDHRLTDRTILTEHGGFVGTPEYMSPEQADRNGQGVDTRTDVYSLGVLLYELLAGAQPFDPEELRDAGLDEVKRKIREVEPPKPSIRASTQGEASRTAAGKRRMDPASLARTLRGDLDWITMKAMEKEPARRYSSAAEVAADIRRHLDHEPVLAGPPSNLYRMAKFVRKHRAGVGFAAALLVVFVGVASTTTAQARRVAQERYRASQEAATATQVTDFLVSLFEVAPGIGPRVDFITARDMLDRSAEKIRQELRDRPVLQARLTHTMGDVYRRLGLHERARRWLNDARAKLDDLLGPDDPETLSCTNSLAKLYMGGRYFEKAESLYRESLDRRLRVLGNDHPDTLRAMSDLAFLYKEWDRDSESEALFRDAIEGLRRVLGDDHPESLIATGFLAGVLLDLGRYEEVEGLLFDRQETMRRTLGDRHLETQAALYNLGCVYANLGDPTRALNFVREAVDAGFGYTGMLQDPHLASLREDPELRELAHRASLNSQSLWAKLNERAKMKIEEGRHDEAERLYLDVIEAAGRLHADGNPDAQIAEYRLAEFYVKAGRYDEAEPLLMHSLAVGRREYGEDDPAIADVLWLLANCRLGNGDRAKGVELVERAIRIYQRGLAPESLDLAYVQGARSALAGEREEALRYLKLAAGHADWVGEWMAVDLVFRSLYGDPEFEAILKRASLAESRP